MAKKKKDNALTRERVLEALAKTPGGAKRDIARALDLKGSDRIALKRILRELEDEGVIERGKKKSYSTRGALPEVTVLEISGQDPDGEILARPARWEGEEEPPPIVVVPGRDDEGDTSLRTGERILARLSETKNGYEARIIKRLGASVHRVLGVFHEIKGRGGRIAPIDRKTRFELIVDPRDTSGAKHNELVLAEPLSGRASGLPRGRILERLGDMNAPKAVSLIAIHAHGIPTDFPKDAVEEAERASEVEKRGRTDLRHVALVTIDPEDARDHDDAVWAGPDDDPKNSGGHIAIVAIADVAHYVTPGSALDREAYRRGNSAYFPDRVVPMLPERLSADLCSLMEGVDRPCLAVRMVFDRQGNKKSHEFIRGIMRSPASLTYAQAQAAFDGKPVKGQEALARETLMPLWRAYQALSEARKKRDPLELDLPERRIVIGEDGKVKSIDYRERLESMKLIEEFMIQANVAAAETLEKTRTPLIYRVHEAPSKEKIMAFADYLRTIGVSFAKGQTIKPGTFNRILSSVTEAPSSDVMNDVVLRTQSQAVYAPENVGHFGLNLQRYAHFTSPIRRYADLVVHRALIRAMKLGEGGLTDGEMKKLGETADHISMTERRAMAAERDSTDRYVAAFMEERVGASFEARVTGVTRFGLFVRLKETGAEGLIAARTMGFEYFRHDEKQHALIGDRSGTRYSLGDILKVKLMEAAPLTGGLRFELVEANAPAARRQNLPPRIHRGKPIRDRTSKRRR
ncbi:MAG: ribonuclease R [Alphaproteobacteria bacterium]|nr:ribonuclease R [Alphaproteobacteria bacterium]